MSGTLKIMFWAFIIGNVLYYAVGLFLAYAFKDNRAFCKYICPVTVFLKPMSYYSLVRVKCDKEKCISCGKCRRVCPMNVDVTDNSRKRENGTECILCMECVKNCPKGALWPLLIYRKILIGDNEWIARPVHFTHMMKTMKSTIAPRRWMKMTMAVWCRDIIKDARSGGTGTSMPSWDIRYERKKSMRRIRQYGNAAEKRSIKDLVLVFFNAGNHTVEFVSGCRNG